VAYYRLLAARSLLKVAQDTVQQRTRHLELAGNRRRAGVGREVEVYQARAERADAALSLVEARSEVRVARGRLASAMGLPVGFDFDIEPIPTDATEAERQEVEQLLVEAAQKRPRLRAAAAEVMRRREQLRTRRAGRWPEVTADGSYGWRDVHLLPEERKEWTLGFRLRLPIFTGYRTSYAIRRAEAELDRAIASYHEELRGVELQIWEAYSELVRAEQALDAAAAFVDSAERSLSAVENAYGAGKATIVELIDAQTTLTRARNRRATARLDWHTAIARLQRQVGRSWDRDAPPQPAKAAGTGRQSID
jgi:outer membrane protein TolC